MSKPSNANISFNTLKKSKGGTIGSVVSGVFKNSPYGKAASTFAKTAAKSGVGKELINEFGSNANLGDLVSKAAKSGIEKELMNKLGSNANLGDLAGKAAKSGIREELMNGLGLDANLGDLTGKAETFLNQPRDIEELAKNSKDKSMIGTLASVLNDAKENSAEARTKFEDGEKNKKIATQGRGPTTTRMNEEDPNRRLTPGTNTGINTNNIEGNRIFELELGEKSKQYSNEPSFYVILAIILKGIVSYTWDFIVLTIKSFYRVFTDFVLIPFFIFLPYVFDVLAVILILILLILVIIYFVSGGKNRSKENNMFDNMLSGFSMIMMPNVGGYVKKSGSVLKDKTGGFIESIKEFFDSIGEALNDFIKSIFRLIKSEANINDIDDNNKHERTKNTGRCDNISQIEKKDGRYCYEQIGKKEIDWGDKKIDYKLLKATHMKKQNKNTHYDYYVPNCKGSNIFTKEFIASCKDSKRTKFICKI